MVYWIECPIVASFFVAQITQTHLFCSFIAFRTFFDVRWNNSSSCLSFQNKKRTTKLPSTAIKLTNSNHSETTSQSTRQTIWMPSRNYRFRFHLIVVTATRFRDYDPHFRQSNDSEIQEQKFFTRKIRFSSACQVNLSLCLTKCKTKTICSTKTNFVKL